MNRKPAMRLWKYNKITGLWNVVRSVTTESAGEWLKVWQKDEPQETFVVLSRKPPSPKSFRDYGKHPYYGWKPVNTKKEGK